MIQSICKKELRLNFLNLRLPLLLILSVFFASLTVVISCKHYQKRVRDYHTRCEYHKTTGGTIHADRPPQVLSIFCNGVFLKAPVSIETQKTRPRFGDVLHRIAERPTDNILFAQIQYPDICFVTAVIVGLGAILFGYDSICGEKEKGTLKLSLSNDIARYKVLLGKFLANTIGLAVIVLLVWLVSVSVVVSEPSIKLTASNFAVIALSCITSFVYIILLVAIVMLISSIGSSSRLSLVNCIALWTILGLLAPPLGPLTAKMIRKVPSYQQLISSKQLLLTRLAEDLNERWNIEGKKAKTTDEARRIFNRVVWGQGTPRWLKENDKLTSEFQAKVAKQADLSRILCSVSPPVAFQFALSELCGTSVASQRYFEQQALNWARVSIADGEIGYREIVPQPDIKQFSITERLSHSLGYLAYMVILAIFCFAVTFVSFLQYDVR